VGDLHPEARRPLSSGTRAPLGSLATAASLRPRGASFTARICILGLAAGLLVIHTSPLTAHAAALPPGTISTYAGGPGSGPGTSLAQGPWGLALSGTTLYIADFDHAVVRAFNTGTGAETVVAGTGVGADTGDGGQASLAGIQSPTGLAVDGSGNLYIATGTRIRKVTPLGVISTLAGGGTVVPGDGGLATNAFIEPWGVAVDGSGNVFIADTFNSRIREVDHTTGIITTVAGTGVQGFGGDGGPATSAKVSYPEDVWVDGGGNLWIADSQNNRIREVVAGTINTVAGNGTAGGIGDGGSALLAELWEPRGVWVDGSGHLFIADQYNARIREVIAGTITTVAGNGTGGFSGDGGVATSAQLNRPMHAIADTSGNLFIADYANMRVRKVSGGNISTVAGNGRSCGAAGDGGPATSATLCNPSAIAVDPSGDLFIADTGNNVIREVTPGDVISTFAGNGIQGSSGDGGLATSAALNAPSGVTTDASGNVYIADTGNNVVRKVSGGNITLFAGSYAAGYSGDGGLATSAKLNSPVGLTVDGSTNVFIADQGNGAIRKVAAGTITTAFPFGSPQSVAVDSSGNIYIANGGCCAWKVTPGGAVSSIASVFTRGVAVGPGDRVLGASDATQDVYLFTATGPVVVAGNGAPGLSGDGGPATAAQLYYPVAVALDPAGDIFITDLHNQRIRRVQAYTAPSAPLAVKATAGNRSATVSWTVPATNGGLALTMYTVTPSAGPPDVVSGSPPGTTTVVSGLSNGTSYTFTVTAANPWSAGPISTPSNAVTPLLAPPGNIITYAGSVGHGPALSVGQYPYSVALAGMHLYIGDFANPVVRDVDLSTGQEGALAGNDSYGYSGDGGQATSAMIQGAGAIAYCGGQTYIADTFNYVIRKIDLSGNITTFAGTGQFGYNGDGGPATSARIGRVFGLACRTSGGLYVSDSDNGAVRIIDAGGTIRTWWHGFSFPTGITELGSADVVAVADSGGDNGVWQLTDQTFSLLAGIPGTAGYNGDGSATSSELNDPRGLAWFGGSPIYIADRGNNRIRQISGTNIATVAGTGVAGFSGDNGVATSAELNQPSDVFTADGVLLWVADSANFRLRKINFNAGGTITSIAGNGTPSLSGDGGQATAAQLGNPYAVALDGAGDVFIADNQNAVVRKVGPTGVITTVAGNGVPGYSGDGGLATGAELNDPRGVAVASNGDIYISDAGNERVRKVDHSTGVISTVVGNGVAGFAGDGGLATLAELNVPRAVALDATGNLYIADTANNRVRVVNPSGTIATFAGTGIAGYSGDSGLATAAQLNRPRGLAIDGSNNVYIGDSANNRVRRVDHGSGNITTAAGNGQAGLSGDGHAAVSAKLNFPFGLALDNAGNLYIADEFNQRIRVVDTHGNIDSVVGACGAFAGFSGDGGPAAIAQVNFPFGLAVDGFGDLFIADVDSNRVRGATGLVGLRGSSCPGPSGSAGSRSTYPSSSSPPPPRIADAGGSAHKFANDTVLPGRVSSVPAQPTRVAPKQPAAQPAPVTKPGAAQPNPPAAQKPPAAGPAPMRGRASAPVAASRSPQNSWPRPDSAWWVLLVPVAVLTVAMILARRRSKSLKRYGR